MTCLFLIDDKKSLTPRERSTGSFFHIADTKNLRAFELVDLITDFVDEVDDRII